MYIACCEYEAGRKESGLNVDSCSAECVSIRVLSIPDQVLRECKLAVTRIISQNVQLADVSFACLHTHRSCCLTWPSTLHTVTNKNLGSYSRALHCVQSTQATQLHVLSRAAGHTLSLDLCCMAVLFAKDIGKPTDACNLLAVVNFFGAIRCHCTAAVKKHNRASRLLTQELCQHA